MNRILITLLAIFASGAAFAATDLRSPRNRSSGGNLCEQANVSGVMTNLVCLNVAGAGNVVIGPGGGTAVNEWNGALQFSTGNSTPVPTYGLRRNGANALEFFANGITSGFVASDNSWTIGPTGGAVVNSVEGALQFGVGSSTGTPTYGLRRNGSNALEFFTNSVSSGVIDSSNNWQVGPSGGTGTHVVNGRLKSTLSTEFGPAAIGSFLGLYAVGQSTTTTTCETLCANADATSGFASDSGHCIFAYHAGHTASTCSDATNETKWCVCVGLD